MSLHDVDIDSQDRTSPTPNHGDKLAEGARMSHGTNSVNYTTDSTSSPTSGHNAGTAGGGNSVVAGFKRLVLTCPVTVLNDGSTLTTATVSHNLGYIPYVESAIESASVTTASGTVTGATVPGPVVLSASIDSVNHIVYTQTYIFPFADVNNVYVNMYNSTGTPVTVTLTCYLYQRAS